MKIRPVGVEFHADRRTDGQTTHRHNGRGTFRVYVKTPNINSVTTSHRNRCVFKRKSSRRETYTEIIPVYYKNHDVTNKYTMQTKCRVFSVKPGSIRI
jgi:hypothetical protein